MARWVLVLTISSVGPLGDSCGAQAYSPGRNFWTASTTEPDPMSICWAAELEVHDAAAKAASAQARNRLILFIPE